MTLDFRAQRHRTFQRLKELQSANIRSTSPGGHVRVTANGHNYSVEIRAYGFTSVHPDTLAEEVIAAYRETMRAARRATGRVLSDDNSGPTPSRVQVTEWHELMRQARHGIKVRADAPRGMARASWSGTDDIKLRIKAVNTAHRHQLEEELGTILSRLTRDYRAAMDNAVRSAVPTPGERGDLAGSPDKPVGG